MMRRFKELRKVIAEDASDYSGYVRKRVGPQDGDQGMDFNKNLAQLNPADIDRINTFLGALAAKPYLDPNQAIKEAQSKLSTVGIQFQLNNGDDFRRSGERLYELDFFGGWFGTDGSTYDYQKQNFIERKLGHRLGLRISSMPTSTGMTSISAEIVPL